MGILQRIQNKLYVDLNPWFRKHVVNPRNRLRLKTSSVSILSSNCIGACISHDLGLQFNSPFVNLWLYPKDFIKYCQDIMHYIHSELHFYDDKSVNYPVAKLDDITIYFMHYHSVEEARQKWIERSQRINPRKVCCILAERDGCTNEDLLTFSRLPYPTVSLVHKPLMDISNTVYIPGFEQDKELGNVMEFRKHQYYGHRYYDAWDYVSFINTI